MAALELINTPLFNDTNLVTYYRYEGNSNDSKGTNNGTDTAITYSTTNAKFGQRAGFNGTTSFIVVATPSGIPTGSGARTVMGWFYPTASPAAFGGLVSLGTDHSANRKSFEIMQTSGNNIYVWLDGADDFQSTGTITLNSQNMVAVTYDGGTTVKIYINGNAVETKTIGGTLNTTSTHMLIGEDSSLRFYTGNEDDVSIFSRALTPTEISNYFNGTWPGGTLKSLMGVG